MGTPRLTGLNQPGEPIGTRAMPAGLTIGFLAAQGVPPAVLADAEREAGRTGVSPDLALLSRGLVTERSFYAGLARDLGAPFLDRPFRCRADGPEAVQAGLVGLPPGGAARLALAPSGLSLARLMAHPRRRQLFASPGIAITSPRLLAASLRRQAASELADRAANALPDIHPATSARGGPTVHERRMVGLALAVLGVAAIAAPVATLDAVVLVAGALFLTAMLVRIAAALESLRGGPPPPQRLPDADLPVYTVLVALHRETAVAGQLVAALRRLDYPASRLDLKFLVEADDAATAQALAAAGLPAWAEILRCPPGFPRTKPRALNFGLRFARGSLVVVFDAEDLPAPDQLRRAAEHFAVAPTQLAALQASLVIDNGGVGWLTRSFALDYAALFDVTVPGLARLGLPVALGGSSNHIRRSALEAVGGWDAWNVTEDADLGLRLARHGFAVGHLVSATGEEAPARLAAWLAQRRRWMKGWMQTSLVQARPGGRLDPVERAALAATCLGTVATALAGPPLAVLLALRLWAGPSLRDDPLGIAATALALVVAVLGPVALLLPAVLGARRRNLPFGLRDLAGLLACQGLACWAAWRAAAELAVAPYRWAKTEHGLTARGSGLTAGGRVPSPVRPPGASG